MPLTLTIDDGIATVTLNRPQALNAIDPDTARDLRAAWQEISQNSAIRVAILTAAGERAFCSGVDLKKTMPPPESFAALHFGSAHAVTGLATLHTAKPLIAAVNGLALGGGLELALLCDIRIASTTASFGLPEVTIGTIPNIGGTQRLLRAVARSDAMLMMLSGERIDAAEALRMGLVSRVVAPDTLQATSRQIALKIAANAPLAVTAVKRLATLGAEMPLAAALELEQQSSGLLRDTADRIEGRRAFAEKRRAVFQGR